MTQLKPRSRRRFALIKILGFVKNILFLYSLSKDSSFNCSIDSSEETI